MTFPKIATDDLLLFGSLFAAAIGGGVVVAATTDNGWLAFGVALVVFGIPSLLLAFMAASEESK